VRLSLTGRPARPAIRSYLNGYLIWDAALSPDGTLLAAAQQGNPDLLLWNTTSESPKPVADRLPGNCCQLVSVVFSPNGQRVLTTSQGGSAYLVSTRNSRDITRVPARGGWVYWGAFSPNGHLIALATQLGVEVWNVMATPREVASEPGIEMRSVAFRPDGKLLASGDQEGASRPGTSARKAPSRGNMPSGRSKDLSAHLRSAPTARSLPQAAMTRPSGSGTRPVSGSSASSPRTARR
jgi:WD40 repeat protein